MTTLQHPVLITLYIKEHFFFFSLSILLLFLSMIYCTVRSVESQQRNTVPTSHRSYENGKAVQMHSQQILQRRKFTSVQGNKRGLCASKVL